MSLTTANVEVTTDSFQNWLDKTNTLLYAYSTTIVTTSANSIGGFTTGNATVNGIFTANSITVSGNSTFGLRGGNVTTANVLYITGNVSIGNASVNTVFSTTTIDTDLALTVLGATTLSNSLSVAGNSSLSGQLQQISGNSNFDSGTLFVDATNNRVGINNTAPGVALRVTGAVDISSTANVQGAANLNSTLGVTGAATLSNTIAVTGNATFSNDVVTVGSSFLSGNLFVVTTGGISLNSVATFQANATFTKNAFVQGNTLTVNVSNFITASNGDLGANITTPLLVMSFPKTYKGGELILNVTKTGTSQVTKILFAHDESNVDLSTYGTVVAPSSSPELGTFTAAINNANVEIKVQQTNINSAVKIMANLF
jgi:hypothetical protein